MTIKVRVLYNDAAVNRRSRAEEVIGRLSETSRSDRQLGLVMPAFARMTDHYRSGDPLLEVVDTEHNRDWNAESDMDFLNVCDNWFRVLNIEHPGGWAHRSMSTGDVVEVDGRAWACQSFGWKEVSIAESDVRDAK